MGTRSSLLARMLRADSGLGFPLQENVLLGERRECYLLDRHFSSGVAGTGKIAEKILRIEDLYAASALWLISLTWRRVELDLDG